MKKKNHFLRFTVAFLMVLSMLPASAFAADNDDVDIAGQNTLETGVPANDQTPAETGVPDIDQTPAETGVPDTDQTPAETGIPDTDQISEGTSDSSRQALLSYGMPQGTDRNELGYRAYSYYNHIDVRVAARLTLITKANGEEISRETINVSTSNVSGTLNGKPVTFKKKSGSGIENEWRAEGLSLSPNSATETVTINCTLSGTNPDGSHITVNTTQTYTGRSTLWELVNNCPGKNGYDIDIKAEDISESFTVDKTVQKIWEDIDSPVQRPESVQIQLYADGNAYDEPVTISASDGWEAYFENLPKYSSGTTEIRYTADEVEVPAGYTKSISDDGLTITNTYVLQKTDISVNKVWNDADNNDGIRPSEITVHLYADGEPADVQPLTLSKAGQWSGTFTDLPVYKAGKKIVYTVQETPVDGYLASVAGDAATGFTITNTHEPETVSIHGRKTWKDEGHESARPESITINLLKNGDPIATMMNITEDADWSWYFGNYPKYDNGNLINYTITENAVPNYSATYDGFNVTNEYTPQEASITVTKNWNDGNNKDKIRPESITIQLCINGDPIEGMTLVLNENNKWTGSFTNLPIYGETGKKIDYTITENKVDGYTAEIRGNAEEGFIVTNSHTPKETPAAIPGGKTDQTYKAVNTGDTTNAALWAILLAAAALCAGITLIFKRNKAQK